MSFIVSQAEARAVNEQEASGLFSIPIEIRQPIYSLAFGSVSQHIQCVTQDHGPRHFKFPGAVETFAIDYKRFRLTSCIADPVTTSEESLKLGYERDPLDRTEGTRNGSPAIYHRRLASTWGPH